MCFAFRLQHLFWLWPGDVQILTLANMNMLAFWLYRHRPVVPHNINTTEWTRGVGFPFTFQHAPNTRISGAGPSAGHK